MSCNGYTLMAVPDMQAAVALPQIYSSADITFTLVGASELTASTAFSGVLRAAAVPSQSAQAVLDTYAGVYPTAGAVSHSVSVPLPAPSRCAVLSLLLARRGSVRKP